MHIESGAPHGMLGPRTRFCIAWKCNILCVDARTEEGKGATVPCMHQLTRVPTCPGAHMEGSK